MVEHGLKRSGSGGADVHAIAAAATMMCSLFLAAMIAAGCAGSLPPSKASSSLFRDLRRLVDVSSATGWLIDRVEVDKLQPDALMSVCQVEHSSREELVDWLDARIDALGGPVAEAYRKRGSRLEDVEELLALSRVRLTLQRAMATADEDCPFWLRPDPRFSGRQIADDRWQLSFGGGGKAIVVHQDDATDLYFGGAGRLVFGRAFGEHWSLLAGIDSGAAGSFPKDEDGERGNLVLGLDVVLPVIVRYRLSNTYLEAEAGPLAHFTEGQMGADPGIHVGIAFGGRATRQRWFFPGAVLGASYERSYPDPIEGGVIDAIKIGFRAAIDLDF